MGRPRALKNKDVVPSIVVDTAMVRPTVEFLSPFEFIQ